MQTVSLISFCCTCFVVGDGSVEMCMCNRTSFYSVSDIFKNGNVHGNLVGSVDGLRNQRLKS